MVCNLVRVNKNLVNNQCDRLLCSLAFVEPTTLALLPVCRMPQASSILVNRASSNPGTWWTPSATCLTPACIPRTDMRSMYSENRYEKCVLEIQRSVPHGERCLLMARASMHCCGDGDGGRQRRPALQERPADVGVWASTSMGQQPNGGRRRPTLQEMPAVTASLSGNRVEERRTVTTTASVGQWRRSNGEASVGDRRRASRGKRAWALELGGRGGAIGIGQGGYGWDMRCRGGGAICGEDCGSSVMHGRKTRSGSGTGFDEGRGRTCGMAEFSSARKNC